MDFLHNIKEISRTFVSKIKNIITTLNPRRGSSKGMIDRQMNTSLFDYDRYVYVDADAVAKECGAVMEESEAFGQKFTHTKWDGEVLRKVLKKIEPDLHGNKVAKDLETGKMPACGSIRLPQADSQE